MIKLRARPRGPLVIEREPGDELELCGMDGQPIDLEGRRHILLCRCGESRARPLCDGSHNRTRFEAPPDDAE